MFDNHSHLLQKKLCLDDSETCWLRQVYCEHPKLDSHVGSSGVGSSKGRVAEEEHKDRGWGAKHKGGGPSKSSLSVCVPEYQPKGSDQFGRLSSVQQTLRDRFWMGHCPFGLQVGVDFGSPVGFQTSGRVCYYCVVFLSTVIKGGVGYAQKISWRIL